MSRLFRSGRTPGLRTARATLAVVAAFLIAGYLHTGDRPILAPLTALLVVQLTLYQTVVHGLGRIGGVLAGVLVAVGVADVVGLTWWSLGGVVALSLVIGRLLRLGPQLFEVPISAMLVLEVGGGGRLAVGRVSETLIGAAVGIAVSALIAPPLYVQPASQAIGELADRLARFAEGLGDALRGSWSRASADHWLDQARALQAEVSHADRSLARAEESARLNMRGKKLRDAQPRLQTALTGLEHCYVTLRSLSRSLLDRTYYMPDDGRTTAYNAEERAALADVLTAASGAIDSVVPVLCGAEPVVTARLGVELHLEQLDSHRDRLRDLLSTDPDVDKAAWQQHGALLAAIDRLRVEIEAAASQPESPWRPEPMTARHRQVVRRIIDTAIERRRG